MERSSKLILAASSNRVPHDTMNEYALSLQQHPCNTCTARDLYTLPMPVYGLKYANTTMVRSLRLFS